MLRRCALAALLLLAVGQASGQIVVDTASDFPADACDDPRPPCRGNGNRVEGDVGDLPGPDGRVSLRDAIRAANRTPGGQSVRLGFNPANTLFLSMAQGPLETLNDSGASFVGSGHAIDGQVMSRARPGRVTHGLVFVGNGNTVRGVSFLGFENVQPALPADLGSVGLFVLGDRNTVTGVRAGVHQRGTASLTVPNAIGISAWGERNTITGNTASGNLWEGIRIRGRFNRVHKNWVGFDVRRSTTVPNRQSGIYVESGANNTIGATPFGIFSILGLFSGQGNDVAGNGTGTTYGGISLRGADENSVGGNRVGSFAGNGAGIVLSAGASSNTIGGFLTPNQLVKNENQGVYIHGAGTKNNRILNNRIGVDPSGARGMGNRGSGVTIRLGASENLVSNCVISSNALDGVRIYDPGTDHNRIESNPIGVGASGTAALPNGRSGVRISGGARRNVVGAPGAANVISANSHAGVFVLDAGTEFNVVEANRIGTDRSGNAALGNLMMGVHLQDGASTTTVKGNVISGNREYGVSLIGAGTADNSIEGNRIGVNEAGDAALSNLEHGVKIMAGVTRTIVGGEQVMQRNLISANTGYGVLLQGAGNRDNKVQGNYIGTDVSGRRELGNEHGVGVLGQVEAAVVGGTKPGSNLISGNRGYGVRLNGGTGVEVSCNLIGTDAAGAGALPNGRDGILLDGANVDAKIGLAGRGNTVSGNRRAGIVAAGQNVRGATIRANRVGTDADGAAAVPNEDDGVQVQFGTGIGVGGASVGEGNTLSGNRKAGLRIANLAERTTVEGNVIGLNSKETAALANEEDGIVIETGARRTTIGGPAKEQANAVAGNRRDGIVVDGSRVSGTGIMGNFIGVDRSSAPFGNGRDGIRLQNGTTQVKIGAPAMGNTIGDNPGNGILVTGTGTGEVALRSNVVGGRAALANGTGVRIEADASTTTIGGAGPEGNEVSHNAGAGVSVDGARSTRIALYGNVIRANGEEGVRVTAASGTVIGEPGKGNTVSGNARAGVRLSATLYATLQGNLIGGRAAGADANATGIRIEADASTTTVGGAGAGDGNEIANNRGAGMEVVGAASRSNRVHRNAFYDNGGLGVDLGADGVTANDAGDADDGPNRLTNRPDACVFVDSRTVPSRLVLEGQLDNDASTGSVVEIFQNDRFDPSGQGEGRTFLLELATTGTGYFTHPDLRATGALPAALPDVRLTAIATDGAGNSSEHATVVMVTTVNVHAADTNSHPMPSMNGLAGDFHFAAVREAAGTMILHAEVEPDTPDVRRDLSWEADGAPVVVGAVGGDRRTMSVPTTAALRIPVRLRYRTATCWRGVAWVIWADGAADVRLETPLAAGSTRIVGFYRSTFTIQPAALIPAAAPAEVPELRGAPFNDVPIGPPGLATVSRSGDIALRGGATLRWDGSRQIRRNVLTGGPPLALPAGRFFETRLEFPRDAAGILPVRDRDIIGNDDANVADEDNDPYDGNAWAVPTAGARGSLFTRDRPTMRLDPGLGVAGNTVEIRRHFLEFVRVELGGVWYRASDFLPWRQHVRLIKRSEAAVGADLNGDGDMLDDVWVDDGSSVAEDNGGF